MWLEARTAPFNIDLELALIDHTGLHVLEGPYRRLLGGWLNTRTDRWLEVLPTHWRPWDGNDRRLSGKA